MDSSPLDVQPCRLDELYRTSSDLTHSGIGGTLGESSFWLSTLELVLLSEAQPRRHHIMLDFHDFNLESPPTNLVPANLYEDIGTSFVPC